MEYWTLRKLSPFDGCIIRSVSNTPCITKADSGVSITMSLAIEVVF